MDRLGGSRGFSRGEPTTLSTNRNRGRVEHRSRSPPPLAAGDVLPCIATRGPRPKVVRRGTLVCSARRRAEPRHAGLQEACVRGPRPKVVRYVPTVRYAPLRAPTRATTPTGSRSPSRGPRPKVVRYDATVGSAASRAPTRGTQGAAAPLGLQEAQPRTRGPRPKVVRVRCNRATVPRPETRHHAGGGPRSRPPEALGRR